MLKASVLICDDNKAVHESLSSYLTNEGFSVYSAYTGESAIDIISKNKIDVLILDVMLPGIDGYDVCRAISGTEDIYIIMVSAKGDEIDRVVGLEIGADDYLVKPISPREITIKVKKAVINRIAPKSAPKKFTMGALTVYPESYQVFYGSDAISLTTKEFDVLLFLISSPGKVLSREHILSAVWGYEYTGDTRTVDALVKRLRAKLVKGPGDHFSIRTIYGIGYTMEEQI